MTKFMLDAGHGYNTPGKRSPNGMKEYEFNREVAKYAKTMLLEYKDVGVYFAHSDSRDVPLSERTRDANGKKVDAYISIHANAHGSGGWTSASGIETFVYTTKPKEALSLAAYVQNQLIRETGRVNRGVKTANFQVLRETHMTAILVEAGFMTNKEEAELLKSDAYRKKVATAIVKGLVDQYKLVKKPSAKPAPKPAPSTSGKLYKVQTGAFADRKNAEALAAKLKKDGYQTFIVQE